VPFWRQACAEERTQACPYLEDMQQTYCVRGSAWACNEFGVLLAQRERDFAGAAEAFQRGCDLGLRAGCANIDTIRAGTATFETALPTLDDYPIILRGTKGPITDRTPSTLYARACDQGWPDACARGGGSGGD
jgi:hypothetical protein